MEAFVGATFLHPCDKTVNKERLVTFRGSVFLYNEEQINALLITLRN